MPRERLAPCPVCKSEPKIHFNPEDGFGTWDTHLVICEKPNDHIVVTMAHTEQEAVAQWQSMLKEGQPVLYAVDISKPRISLIWTCAFVFVIVLFFALSSHAQDSESGSMGPTIDESDYGE